MDATNLDIKYVTITPETAIQLLQNGFERQRNLRPAVTATYAQAMKRGTWDDNSIIRICVVDDKDYLIDGQHRLNAVIKAGIPQTFIVQRQRVEDLETIARIYTMIDKSLARSVGDDLKALGFADRFDITADQARRLSSAVALIATDFRKPDQKTLHSDDRIRMMQEYLPAYHKYIRAIVAADRVMKPRMYRSATLGVALVTFRYSATKYHNVTDFWSGVASDDGILAEDPRKYCNRHLMYVGMIGGGASGENFIKHQTAAVSSRLVAGYFNAFIEERSMKQSIKVLDPYKPIIILGSPFDGKQK